MLIQAAYFIRLERRHTQQDYESVSSLMALKERTTTRRRSSKERKETRVGRRGTARREGAKWKEGEDRKSGRTELGTQPSCKGVTRIPCTELLAFNF